MKQNKKTSHLNQSPLFNSLLNGDEIRYSDIIAYLIKRFNIIPFDKEINKGNYQVHREKKHTDIWINKFDINRTGEIFEIPDILVENKLKSLPDESQLKEYTEIFIAEFIESFKNVIRRENPNWQNINRNRLLTYQERIICEIKNLRFYLLTPISDSNFHIRLNLPEINAGIDLELTIEWKNVSYETLGIHIHKFLKNNSFRNVLKSLYSLKSLHQAIYEFHFFNDFAKILMSFSQISEDLKTFAVQTPVLKFFTPDEVFSDMGLEVLYAKVRASKCATHLSQLKGVQISGISCNLLSVGTIVANFDFSNGHSLFEYKRKLTDHMTYIIQYQAGVLKKGLVISPETAQRFENWFRADWIVEGITLNFQILNVDAVLDIDRYNTYNEGDKVFYYSKCIIANLPEPDLVTVDKLTRLMVEKIDEIEELLIP